jgi:predicted nucleotidyltransferase
MLSEGDIARIGQRIVRGYGPLVVGVFGSYAIGRAHAGSDLDVFVIKRTPEPRPARRHAVMRHLLGVLHPLDVHVFTPDEFEEEAQENLSFAWVIARQARVYYAADGADVHVPSLVQRTGARVVVGASES